MQVAGAVAASLSLAWPALAQGANGEAFGAGIVLPTFQYSVPGAPHGPIGAKDSAVPGETKVPAPAPNGCPFRDGKLELIA